MVDFIQSNYQCQENIEVGLQVLNSYVYIKQVFQTSFCVNGRPTHARLWKNYTIWSIAH